MSDRSGPGSGQSTHVTELLFFQALIKDRRQPNLHLLAASQVPAFHVPLYPQVLTAHGACFWLFVSCRLGTNPCWQKKLCRKCSISSQRFLTMSSVILLQVQSRPHLCKWLLLTTCLQHPDLCEPVCHTLRAGIEAGAMHAMYFADSALVCTNPELSSVRDSDRMIGLIASKSRRAVTVCNFITTRLQPCSCGPICDAVLSRGIHPSSRAWWLLDTNRSAWQMTIWFLWLISRRCLG